MKKIVNVGLEIFLFTIVLISGAAMIFLLVPTHDYKDFYLPAWGMVLKGESPWDIVSLSYGPSFILFAPLTNLHIGVPHFIHFISYLVGVYVITRIMNELNISKKLSNLILVVLLFNPLFWVFIIRYGINDGFLAFTIIMGLYLYKRGFKKTSTTLLAFGGALKFFPIVLIPNLTFANRKIDWVLISTFLIVLFLCFGLGYIMYQSDIFYPFEWAAKRNAKWFSIFRFIGSPHSPFLAIGKPNLNLISTILTLFAIIFSILVNYKYKIDFVHSSFFNYSAFLLFNKVVHHQYYVTLLLLMTWVSILNIRRINENRVLKTCIIGFWSYIFFMSLWYYLNYNQILEYFRGVETLSSIPAFALQLLIHVLFLRPFLKRKNHQSFQTDGSSNFFWLMPKN